MKIPDEQLVEDFKKGDRKAFEVLVKRYIDPVYGFVCRYTGNGQDAEDITQDTFVKVWKNAKRFDVKRKFKTWIFSIAKNTIFDFLKKKKTAPFPESDEMQDTAPLPQEIAMRADTAKILNAAISKLSPEYRATLLLRYKDNFTFREIAEILDCPLDTVKSRYRRALIILKKDLMHQNEPLGRIRSRRYETRLQKTFRFNQNPAAAARSF